MFDSHDSMPWNQSEDLDFDAARAEWERGQDQSAAYANYTAETATDTPEQIVRASIASYREYTERYGQSPDDATEAAVREVLEGLAVDVEAERAEMAEHPGPTPTEMEGWPL